VTAASNRICVRISAKFSQIPSKCRRLLPKSAHQPILRQNPCDKRLNAGK
jgi:hypothetical protein